MTESEQRDTNEWVHSIAGDIERKNGGGVSWTMLLAALGFAGSVIYGAWALEQSQLTSIKETIEQLRMELTRRETEIKATIGASDRALAERINQVESELQRRRFEFTDIREYNEFKARILDEIKTVKDQLHILEQTRPTTGELQGGHGYLNDRINKLYELYQDLNRGIRHAPQP